MLGPLALSGAGRYPSVGLMVAGPEALWLWNGDLTAELIEGQLAAARAGGFRSLAVWPWAGLTTPFLGEAYLGAVQLAAEHASLAGVTLWLADEVHWPSGIAGGQLLVEEPEVAQRALVCSTRWTASAAPQTLRWRGEGEQLVVALALDDAGGRRDLGQQLEENGRPARARHTAALEGYRARWETDVWESEIKLPPGEWFVTIATVVRVHPLLRPAVGCGWSPHVTGALDVLSEAAVERYVARALTPLAEAAAPYAGKGVAGIVSVTPPWLLAHAVTRPEGWRTDVLPWMPDLPDVFERLFERQLGIHFPYVLAPLHDGQVSQPLERLLAFAEERRDALFVTHVGEWCAGRGLERLVLDPGALNRLPQLALSTRAERKKGLSPERAVLPLAEAVTIPHGAVGSLTALRSGSERSSEPFVELAEEWQFAPASLNLLPLGDWQEWQHVGRSRDGTVRYDVDLSFEADYVPEDLLVLFEAGVVESVSVNRKILSLTGGRPPRPDEIEAPDAALRVLELPRGLVRTGRNNVSAAAVLPASDRVQLEGAASGGPIFLAGAFALEEWTSGVVGLAKAQRWRMVRPRRTVNAGDWRAAGYPRYSGTATYAQTLSLPRVPEGAGLRLWVDGHGGPVGVRVDGTAAGRAAASPFVFDVATRGSGGLTRVEIQCASGLAPRLAGDGLAGLAGARLELRR